MAHKQLPPEKWQKVCTECKQSTTPATYSHPLKAHTAVCVYCYGPLVEAKKEMRREAREARSERAKAGWLKRIEKLRASTRPGEPCRCGKGPAVHNFFQALDWCCTECLEKALATWRLGLAAQQEKAAKVVSLKAP